MLINDTNLLRAVIKYDAAGRPKPGERSLSMTANRSQQDRVSEVIGRSLRPLGLFMLVIAGLKGFPASVTKVPKGASEPDTLTSAPANNRRHG